MDLQKFEIEGEIEHPKGDKEPSIMGRFALFLFVIAVVGAVLYFPFLQDRFPALKKITIGAGVDSVQVKQLQNTVAFDSLKKANDSLVKANELLLENSNTVTGVFYEVQIGAFKNFDLAKYKKNLADLRGVEDEGYAKMTLGRFRELGMARTFLKDVREMGFKDAWIVAKKDGKRIPFKNEQLTEEMP